MRSIVAGHQKLTTANREHNFNKLTFLQRTWEVAQELNVDHSKVVWHLKQIGKVKKLDKCVPHELSTNQKKIVLKCHLLLFYATRNHFVIRLWCAIKSGVYAATSDDWLSTWTEKKLQSTSQSQTCSPKKAHGHCWVVCWLSDPLQLSESQWNHYICEVCSANRWDAPKTAMSATGIDQQKGPSCSPRQCLTACYISNASKTERIGLWSFASSSIFTWHITNRLLLFQASQQRFAGKMLPQLTVYRKCFPRICQIPKQGFLCSKNKQTYFSLTEMCWL